MPVLEADPVEFRWPAAATDEEEDGVDVDSLPPAAGEDKGASASDSDKSSQNFMTMLLRFPYFGTTTTTMKTKRDFNGRMN